MPRYISEAPKTERPAIPAGSYVLTLKEIKDYKGPVFNAVPDPETGETPMKDQLIWIFEADKKAQDGKPYEFAQFTGLYYGDSRANMTHLLDWMLPDLDHDTKRHGVDVEALIGFTFKARIQHQPNRKGDMKPTLTMLDPIDTMPIDRIVPALAAQSKSEIPL